MNIILASNSPRRKEILAQFGYSFTVIKSNYKETDSENDPINTVVKFAKGKAEDVYNTIKQEESNNKDIIVLGADTVVYYDGKILGKPRDKVDAENTLKKLSGKIHKVITGYAVLSDKIKAYGYDVSEVIFNNLTEDIITKYVASGKPLDKAGSYGVQDGYGLVKKVKGSTFNVIGLPIEKISTILDGIVK